MSLYRFSMSNAHVSWCRWSRVVARQVRPPQHPQRLWRAGGGARPRPVRTRTSPPASALKPTSDAFSAVFHAIVLSPLTVIAFKLKCRQIWFLIYLSVYSFNILSPFYILISFTHGLVRVHRPITIQSLIYSLLESIQV